MKILYSPQVSHETIEYNFLPGEKIECNFEEKSEIFDLSQFSEDGYYHLTDEEGNKLLETELPVMPIRELYRENGVLYVVLLRYIPEDAKEEEKYPQCIEV